MPESLAEATAAAEAEQARYLDLQHRALHAEPADRPQPSEVGEASHSAELAQRRVEIARKREEQAREAARQEALRAVGRDVEAYAATDPATAPREALRRAAEAVQAYRAAAAAHDDAVADLTARAATLALPGGRWGDPWERQLAGGTYRDVTVTKFGDQARIALEHALAGDVEGAAGDLVAVRSSAPPKPDAYYRDVLPDQIGVIPVCGRPYPALAEMIRNGRMVKMSPQEVAEWQASRQ